MTGLGSLSLPALVAIQVVNKEDSEIKRCFSHESKFGRLCLDLSSIVCWGTFAPTASTEANSVAFVRWKSLWKKDSGPCGDPIRLKAVELRLPGVERS